MTDWAFLYQTAINQRHVSHAYMYTITNVYTLPNLKIVHLRLNEHQNNVTNMKSENIMLSLGHSFTSYTLNENYCFPLNQLAHIVCIAKTLKQQITLKHRDGNCT